MIGLIVLGIVSMLGERALGDNLTDQLTGNDGVPRYIPYKMKTHT